MRSNCLPDLLREQVLARPLSTAVISQNERVTYRELAERCSGLAGQLRRSGVQPDDGVGIFVDPSIDMIVGVWGVLLAGGAYLPLSPDYPDQRLRYVIENARLSVILCQDDLERRLAKLVPANTTIVGLKHATGRDTAPEFGADLSPENLAYIIYTSGSTGKPKGVLVEQRGIVNQMLWLNASGLLNGEKVILQKTPMSFDAAQWEILAPCCGSTVVAGEPGLHRDIEGLIDTIVRHDITTVQCVPTLLEALVSTGKLRDCTSLTHIFSGGETLPTGLARQCAEQLPTCELVNLYGPTECTINSTAFTVSRDAARG